jgi:hypothetical protein
MPTLDRGCSASSRLCCRSSLRGMLPAVAPWLLLSLALGGLVGLLLGLIAFRYADPTLVRSAAGAMKRWFVRGAWTMLVARFSQKPDATARIFEDVASGARRPLLRLCYGS